MGSIFGHIGWTEYAYHAFLEAYGQSAGFSPLTGAGLIGEGEVNVRNMGLCRF
jgi:hypothetical protein